MIGAIFANPARGNFSQRAIGRGSYQPVHSFHAQYGCSVRVSGMTGGVSSFNRPSSPVCCQNHPPSVAWTAGRVHAGGNESCPSLEYNRVPLPATDAVRYRAALTAQSIEGSPQP